MTADERQALERTLKALQDAKDAARQAFTFLNPLRASTAFKLGEAAGSCGAAADALHEDLMRDGQAGAVEPRGP